MILTNDDFIENADAIAHAIPGASEQDVIAFSRRLDALCTIATTIRLAEKTGDKDACIKIAIEMAKSLIPVQESPTSGVTPP